MDDRLRNGLWNCVHNALHWRSTKTTFASFTTSSAYALYKQIWDTVLGQRNDTLPTYQYQVVELLGKWVKSAPWFKVYDLIEFVAKNGRDAQSFIDCCNTVLERESAGYRFLSGKIAPIVSKEEMAEIEKAISAPGPAATHLKAAVATLADRASPNPRKVVHESISAVESAVRALLGDEKVTLGEGLKRLNLDLHPALVKGFGNLYGWTSDGGSGIRHGLSGEPWTVDGADARYMLITCSAFINYLRAKSGKELP